MHFVYKLSDNMIVKMEVGSFELRMLLLETSGETTVELQTVRCTLYINLKNLFLASEFWICPYNFQSVSAYSGHYRPTAENLGSFLAFLNENVVNLDESSGMQLIWC